MSDELEVMSTDSSMVAMLNKSEIDQQIATAHKYPRSIKRFRDEATAMVTLNERVASECIYALPRDGKTIEGPSARFAEVVASAWGNSRAGARVVSDQGDFVTAQGIFHDLERNVAITYEVQRRIVNKQGVRFKPDMIGVTANAACSVALRNAILKGVPKAFWSDMYESARAVVMGDFKTLANRRAEAIKLFLSYGVSKEQICATLGVAGEEDISLENLVVLRGILTAIKDGDTTPEMAFAVGANIDIAQPKSKTVAPQQTETIEQPKTTKAKSKDKPEGQATEQNPNLATEGEKAFLMSKAGDLLGIQEAMGVVGISDFDNLTKDGFTALKEYFESK